MHGPVSPPPRRHPLVCSAENQHRISCQISLFFLHRWSVQEGGGARWTELLVVDTRRGRSARDAGLSYISPVLHFFTADPIGDSEHWALRTGQRAFQNIVVEPAISFFMMLDPEKNSAEFGPELRTFGEVGVASELGTVCLFEVQMMVKLWSILGTVHSSDCKMESFSSRNKDVQLSTGHCSDIFTNKWSWVTARNSEFRSLFSGSSSRMAIHSVWLNAVFFLYCRASSRTMVSEAVRREAMFNISYNFRWRDVTCNFQIEIVRSCHLLFYRF